MDLTRWKQRLQSTIAGLEANAPSLLGYPVGEGDNVVTDPTGAPLPADLPRGLAAMYREIGEVSLPDIGNGYFVHPPSYLTESVARGLPVGADTAVLAGPVTTFGSDGGGTLYCVPAASDAVWALPAGEIVNGVYRGGMAAPRLIAASVEEFLDRLLDDAATFVESGQSAGL